MRVFEVVSQREVLLFAYLDRKAEKAAVSQRAPNSLKHPRQVSDVDKYVGGTRKIELFGLRLQELDQLTADQSVVDLTLPRDLEHVRGNIDPGQRSSERMKSCSEKTRTATKVQNVQIARSHATRHRIRQ